MKECLVCGQGTRSTQTRIECVTNCIFNPIESVNYNLKSLSKRLNIDSKNDESDNEYLISICSAIQYYECQNSSCDYVKNFLYLVVPNKNNATHYGFGNSLNFIPDPTANFSGISNKTYFHTFDLIYNGSSNPPPGCSAANTKATIKFYCNPFEVQGDPELIEENNCDITLRWVSPVACRVCVFKDLVDEITECQSGQQNVVSKKINSCFGSVPEPITTVCESVSVQKTTALIIGVIVTIIVVILLLVVLFCYFKKKNLEVEYRRIMEEKDLEGDL